MYFVTGACTSPQRNNSSNAPSSVSKEEIKGRFCGGLATEPCKTKASKEIQAGEIKLMTRVELIEAKVDGLDSIGG